jgi:hypothetical protein
MLSGRLVFTTETSLSNRLPFPRLIDGTINMTNSELVLDGVDVTVNAVSAFGSQNTFSGSGSLFVTQRFTAFSAINATSGVLRRSGDALPLLVCESTCTFTMNNGVCVGVDECARARAVPGC